MPARSRNNPKNRRILPGPRRSFVVALKDVKKLWEMSYDPDAAPVFSGMAQSHEKGAVEGIAEKQPFARRRVALDDHRDDFFFAPRIDDVIGASRPGAAAAYGLNVRRRAAAPPLEGLPYLGLSISWLRQGRRVMAAPHLKRARQASSTYRIGLRSTRSRPRAPASSRAATEYAPRLDRRAFEPAARYPPTHRHGDARNRPCTAPGTGVPATRAALPARAADSGRVRRVGVRLDHAADRLRSRVLPKFSRRRAPSYRARRRRPSPAHRRRPRRAPCESRHSRREHQQARSAAAGRR